MFEHPLMIGTSGVEKMKLEFARQMTVALLARGLQMQARGDPAAFVSFFHSVLILVQSLRNGTAVACLEMSNTVERTALLALDRWLEHLHSRAYALRSLFAPAAVGFESASAPEQVSLIETAIGVLESCDPVEPFDSTKQYLVERHVIREAMKAPVQWLPQLLALSNDNAGPNDPLVEVISMAWAVPWEKERTRRLVGMGFEATPPTDDSLLGGRPGMGLMVRSRNPADLAELNRQVSTNRRAGLLKLALRAFWLEHGHFPKNENLGELVTAGYLHRLPLDPYKENEEFKYRVVTEREKLLTPARPQTERILISQEPPDYEVLPGQAIIWSVGQDGKDDGGKNPPGLLFGRSEDIVFVIPEGPTY
jgi:hypothetical protein